MQMLKLLHFTIRLRAFGWTFTPILKIKYYFGLNWRTGTTTKPWKKRNITRYCRIIKRMPCLSNEMWRSRASNIKMHIKWSVVPFLHLSTRGRQSSSTPMTCKKQNNSLKTALTCTAHSFTAVVCCPVVGWWQHAIRGSLPWFNQLGVWIWYSLVECHRSPQSFGTYSLLSEALCLLETSWRSRA